MPGLSESPWGSPDPIIWQKRNKTNCPSGVNQAYNILIDDSSTRKDSKSPLQQINNLEWGYIHSTFTPYLPLQPKRSISPFIFKKPPAFLEGQSLSVSKNGWCLWQKKLRPAQLNGCYSLRYTAAVNHIFQWLKHECKHSELHNLMSHWGLLLCDIITDI